MNFRATRILAAALLASSCGLAISATATANFTVTATVAANCTVTTATSTMAFGTYVPGTPKTGTMVVSLNCTNSTPYTVGISDGSGGGTATSTRLMKSTATPADTLEYNLYTNVGHTNYWSDPLGYAPTDTHAVSGIGAGMLATATTMTVYGLLPDSTNNQVAKPHADYSDLITVNVYY